MRRCLIVVVVAGLVAACAPARAASPPVPEMVGAEPVAGHATGAQTASDGDRAIGEGAISEGVWVDTDHADPDVGAPDGGGPDDGADVGDVEDGLSGWSAFDRSLERSIIENGSPAMSVAVMSNGEPVRTTAFGVRDPAADAPTPVDVDTRFRVASISKIVTAIVVLQLVEDGLIGLDEPIGTRLAASLGVDQVSPGAAALTAEHLLSHTSGIGGHQNTFFGGRGLTCAEAGAQALTGYGGTPGGGMIYSNMNSCLAHLLIEDVTGQPYVDAVYQRLLTPLGITGMRLAGTYDTGPDEAVHFSRPGRNYMEALGGAGAWIATAGDIARIVDSLDPDGGGWRPLGDDMLRRMSRPPLGRDAGGYGLGLILWPDGSFGHTGTLESTHAMVVSRPDGVTWAVLVNGEHPRNSGNLRAMIDRAFVAGFPDG